MWADFFSEFVHFKYANCYINRLFYNSTAAIFASHSFLYAITMHSAWPTLNFSIEVLHRQGLGLYDMVLMLMINKFFPCGTNLLWHFFFCYEFTHLKLSKKLHFLMSNSVKLSLDTVFDTLLIVNISCICAFIWGSQFNDNLRAGGPRSLSSNPSTSIIFTSPYHPDRLWGTPHLLTNGYQGLCTQG
jgi:hypothetical protein